MARGLACLFNKIFWIVLGLLWLLAMDGRAWAQTPNPAGDGTADEPKTVINVKVGQSRTIQMPDRVQRVSVADPKIADVQVLDPMNVLVLGSTAGATDLTTWGEDDRLWRARINVEIDVKKLQQDIDRLFPKANLRVTNTQGVYVVVGTLARADQVSALHQLLEGTGVKYVNMTQIPGLNQVQLKVRVAEVSRASIRALGINALKTGKDFFGASLIGSATGVPLNPAQIGPAKGAIAGNSIPFIFPENVGVSPAVTLLAGFPNTDLEFFVQALAENQYLRVLAEPTLLALSGEEANFLSGGEFPIPVVQGTSGAGLSITIEYKEFGVRLKFLPTVLGENRIRMKVAPEVSSLSDFGAVEIQGFRVPSLTTRRADTTLEMQSGQTFAIAGLLDQRQIGRSSRVPLLGDIPLLGALFRTVRYEQDNTELVVLVEASLVEPLGQAGNTPVPGEKHHPPCDWDLYIKGGITGRDEVKLSPVEQDWLRQKGFDKLKGPGGWDEPERPAGISQAPIQPPAPAQ